jgi:hypothetical protein
MVLVGDSGTRLKLDNATRNDLRKALFIYGKRNDGKYDTLVVYTTQTKTVATDKLMICCAGSICVGIIAGVATNDTLFGLRVASFTETSIRLC